LSELQNAAAAVLAESDQSDEFKRRLIRLLENALTNNYMPSDVRQVVDLAEYDEEAL
jgi:hypothetical protein